MTKGLYIECPTCPKYRPGEETNLVLKEQKYCRWCMPKVKKARKRRKNR